MKPEILLAIKIALHACLMITLMLWLCVGAYALIASINALFDLCIPTTPTKLFAAAVLIFLVRVATWRP